MNVIAAYRCKRCEMQHQIKPAICNVCKCVTDEPLQDDTRSFNGYYASNPENNGRRDGY